jgi:ADP-ribose pyrophosphatase YjhB (NUDIX family)
MAISHFYRALRDRIGHDLLPIPAVAAVIYDNTGRILLQQHQDKSWSLPAGAQEPGEHPAQAIVREVLEETGLVVRPRRVLAVLGGPHRQVVYPNGDRVQYSVTVFECESKGGTLLAPSDETRAIEYFVQPRMPDLNFPYPQDLFLRNSAVTFFEWDDAWL